MTTAAPASDPLSQPFWTLTCSGDAGLQLGVLDQPATKDAAGGLDFTVPQGCEGQWLVLILKSSDAPNLTGAIGSVEVSRRPSA